MIYIDALSHELYEVGIRGRLRRRIVVEIEDHLSCDPEAQLGSPAEVARSFAEQLGSGFARLAALWAFAALAVVGVLFAAVLVTARAKAGPLPRLRHGSSGIDDLGLALASICPQVALVAGCLGAIRALRLRGESAIGRGEARVLLWRAMIGLLAGAGSLLGIALLRKGLTSTMPAWWSNLVLVTVSLGGVALVCALRPLLRSWRIQPRDASETGDVFDDLPAFVGRLLGDDPWRLALLTSAAIVLALSLAGVIQEDPFDGLARGLLDALACLLAFAMLGRFIGLWSRHPRREG